VQYGKKKQNQKLIQDDIWMYTGIKNDSELRLAGRCDEKAAL